CLGQLGEQCQALLRRRQSIPDSVTAIAARLLVGLDRESAETTRNASPAAVGDSPFECEILAAVREQRNAAAQLDRASADLAAQIQRLKDQLAALATRQNLLAPLAEAKAGRRRWTPAWWRRSALRR